MTEAKIISAQKPAVSICILTYNRADYLKEAIQSVLGQTFTDFELLVLDNASQDNTKNIIESFNDNRIRYYRNPQNIGPLNSVKRGIKLAEGKYWMILCDDDFISPNYIECMVRLMEQYPIVMAYGAGAITRQDGKILDTLTSHRTYWLPGKEFLKKWFTVGVPVTTPLYVFTLIEDSRPWITSEIFSHHDNIDNAFVMTLALKGNVGLTDKCVYYYRQHPGNGWRNLGWREKLQSIKALMRLTEKEPAKNYWDLLPLNERKELRRTLYDTLVKQHLSHVFSIDIKNLNIIELGTAILAFPLSLRYFSILRKYLYAHSVLSVIRFKNKIHSALKRTAQLPIWRERKTKELLSISIPTRNRQGYLKELLNTIEQEIGRDNHILHDIKIYIFDNDSTDGTSEVIKRSTLEIIYKKNPKNIGMGPNIYQAYTAVNGKYVWVIGDDELLPKDAIHIVLQWIKSYSPCLIIARDKNYNAPVDIPMFFPNYLEFIRFAERYNAHLLIAHSLVSCNIILKSCFNEHFALCKMKTDYGFFYGIIKGIKNHPGEIIYAQEETIIVRAVRAISEQMKDYRQAHINYISWLKKEYRVKHLMPDRMYACCKLDAEQKVSIWGRILRACYRKAGRSGRRHAVTP